MRAWRKTVAKLSNGLIRLAIKEKFRNSGGARLAFYRDGRVSEAARWVDRALALGVVDALLYFRASEIYSAAGNEIEGRTLRKRASNLSPAVAGFHVHH
jgi:hypothetical protein